MANHEAVAAFPVAPGTANKQLARDMAVRRMPYVILSDTEMASLVAVDPASTVAIQDIILNGRVYHNNPGDQGGSHDGTTILVSQEGIRYKLAAGTDVVAYAVISKTVTDPNTLTPANGDAYLVAPGGVNAWAGKDNQVAIKTARGWEFVNFSIGRMLYVQNTDSYWHKNASGVWTIGFGSQSLAANTISVQSIIGRPVRWLVLNMTTTTPPPSPTPGQAYIISSTPSGPWLPHPGKIAIYESGADFTIYQPRVGELAFNQDSTVGAYGSLSEVRFNGTSWLASAAAYQLLQTQLAAAQQNVDFIFGADVNEYDSFEIVISSLKVTVAGDALGVQFGTGAPPTYVTSGLYFGAYIAGAPTQASANTGITVVAGNKSTGQSMIYLTATTVTGEFLGIIANHAFHARVNFDNPESTDLLSIDAVGRYMRSVDGLPHAFHAAGYLNQAGPFTAIRFKTLNNNNIAAGRFSLYGRRKS